MKKLGIMIQEYLHKTGWRRFAVMFLGNVLAGMGIGIFKLSSLGNDPFSGMNMALSANIGISYPMFQILLNIVFLTIEFIFGRSYIGLGTLVNAVFLGYIASFFYEMFRAWYIPEGLPAQILVLVVGMIICSLGLSMYQTSNVGVAPYDSIPLIMDQKFRHIPFFWCRMLCDGSCALICYLGGGIIGLGTLVTAFGFGPFIHFFDHKVSKRLAGM